MLRAVPRSLLALSLVWLPLTGALAGECDAWRIEGYTLGMSQDDAAQIRAMKTRKGKGVVKEKGSFKGTLLFDETGTLVQWAAQYLDIGHDELKRRLTESLGNPIKNEEFVGTNRIGGHSRTSLETQWIHEDCDAIVMLRREMIKVYANNTLQVDTEKIYLVLTGIGSAESVNWKSIY
jgi:hypothetical protein